jgi:hypothetical protein
MISLARDVAGVNHAVNRTSLGNVTGRSVNETQEGTGAL